MAVKSNSSANRINTNWFGIGGILRTLFWNARNVVKKSEYPLIMIPLRIISLGGLANKNNKC